MDINIVILDREQLDEAVTVEFINPLTNDWILRLEVWASDDPELIVQSTQLNSDTVGVFLGILRVGADLLNTLYEVGAKSFSEVSEVVNASSNDDDNITFSLN